MKPLKVLHLPGTAYPHRTGGKEIYCHHLALELNRVGVSSVIAVPSTIDEATLPSRANIEGVIVCTLPERLQRDRSEIYSCDMPVGHGFVHFLKEFQPHVVHFHTFSERAGLSHLRAVKAVGAKAIMTYHTAGQFCLQRTLLFRGREICDGKIQLIRCSACRLNVAGVPIGMDYVMAGLPQISWGEDLSLPMARALTVRLTTARFIRAWRECLVGMERFVIHSEWSAALLRKNNVPAKKLVMIRSGLPGRPDMAPVDHEEMSGEQLRLAFVARVVPEKGANVLIDAVQKLPPEVFVKVVFFGPYWDDAYGQQLLAMIRNDPRFAPPRLLESKQVVKTLRGFDACVVPSICLETGPLVVLEAFAAGIPVIGSRLGGIAELVQEGKDGLLFTPGDSAMLASHLRRLAQEPEELVRLKAGVRPPRRMADVADEMLDLYQSLVRPMAG